MKRIFTLLLLLLPVFAWAQTSPLDGYPPRQGHRALYGNPTSSTPIDTLFWRIGIIVDSLLVANDQGSTDAWAIISAHYPNIASALTAARSSKRVLIIPVGETGLLSPTSADSLQTMWDFRNAWKKYGTRTWGFNTVTEADSLNRFQKIADSTLAAGYLKFGDGTWSFSNYTFSATKPLRIEGTSVVRLTNTQAAWPFSVNGTIFKSTSSTATQHLFNVGYSGNDIYHAMLIGNNRSNGVGFYGYRGDGNSTTQGDYSINNSLAAFHGGDGVRYVSSDGNMIWQTDSYNNKGYGYKITSTRGDSLDGGYRTLAPYVNENEGGYTMLIGGRSRFNTKGGLHSFQQLTTTVLGYESVTDSSVNIFFEGSGTTNAPEMGRANARPLVMGSDFEFVLPRSASPTERTANVKLDNVVTATFMNNYWGSVSSQSGLTADASTDATHTYDSGIVQRPTDYYVGWVINNSTESSGDVAITASSNTGSTTILTHASITNNSSGDTFTLEKNADRGMLADSVWSAVLINNNPGTQADSVVVSQHFSNLLFIGDHPNFDPRTDIKELSGTDNNWGEIALSRLITGGQLWVTSNEPLNFQRGATSSASNLFDLWTWKGLSNDVRPENRFYFDSNTSAATLSEKYITMNSSATQNNAMTYSGSDDSVRAVYAMPIEFSGNAGTARYWEVLTQTTNPTGTPASNRVRFYGYEDTPWIENDSGDTLNIGPYYNTSTWNPGNLASGAVDSTTVSVTNADLGDAIMVGHTGITGANANIQLWGHCITNGSVRVFARNNSGGTYDIPSGVLRIRTWR